MKKHLYILLLLIGSSYIYSQNPTYETFKINGKTLKKWVTIKENLFSYDDNGNAIYKKTPYSESWVEYDDSGNPIKFTYQDGKILYYEYDEKNNLVHSKWSYGSETFNEYDENNNLIVSKKSNGIITTHDYDKKGNMIHWINTEGDEYWILYDSHNVKIYTRLYNLALNEILETNYEYDNNNNIISETFFISFRKAIITTYEYNSKNQIVHKINFDPDNHSTEEYYYAYEYDEKGRTVKEIEYKCY